jgi:ABC transporter permease protein
MPETQRARVIQIFRKVSKLMEATQNIFESKVNANIDGKIAVKDREKYLADKKAGLPEDMSNRVSFFSFTTSTLDASKYDSDADSNKKFMFNE